VDDAAGWCRGCFRTLDEIICWRDMNPAQQRAILRLLPHREALAHERHQAGSGACFTER
jgi:predicted Fe-S protein YdhL (DUF1289 family)